MTPHLTQVLAKGPLFQQLPPKLRQCLISKAQPRSYGRGAVICLQGEQARTLKLVLDGWVKLYRVSGSGDEAVLATLQAADSFDEVAALQGGGIRRRLPKRSAPARCCIWTCRRSVPVSEPKNICRRRFCIWPATICMG